MRPTRLEERVIAGRKVWIKRDDETSDLYGGNKPRSLEFLLAGNPRRLLTFSTLQAHHAHAVAVHGARLGLRTDVVLVRRGERGELADRVHEEAARVREVSSNPGALAAAAALWKPGTRIIPPGGLSARGALGYALAAFEFESVPPVLYAPLGTGTTITGLLAGFMMRRASVEVVGVRVADRIAAWPLLLWNRAFRAVNLLRRKDPSIPRPDRGSVSLRVVYSGTPYGVPESGAIAAVAAAKEAGLALETTYTGPALALLLREGMKGATLLNTYAPS